MSPTSPSHTSLHPILDVLKSLVSRPQVPSPHIRVPMSLSHFYTQPMKTGFKIKIWVLISGFLLYVVVVYK